MRIYTDPQGSEAWLSARRGVITGSRFKDCRDRSDGLTAQQRSYVDAILAGKDRGDALALAGYKKAPTADAVDRAIAGNLEMTWGTKAVAYAMDVARERMGGTVGQGFASWQMRTGTAEEPFGRMAYEERTRNIVTEAGFITTDDRMFGCSVDGLIGDDGIFECKTMVSSSTLFQAVVEGDISEYVDQCNGELWLLGRKWVDLVLWAPDLENCGLGLTIIRIDRDDDAIHELESDLLAFAGMVDQFETSLRQKAA